MAETQSLVVRAVEEMSLLMTSRGHAVEEVNANEQCVMTEVGGGNEMLRCFQIAWRNSVLYVSTLSTLLFYQNATRLQRSCKKAATKLRRLH